MGDFNSKHAYFGCKNQNKEGDILFDSIEDLNLLVVNDDQTIYHKGTDYCNKSWIIWSRGRYWERPLTHPFNINSDKITKQRIKEILKFEKTNWSKFNYLINKHLPLFEVNSPREIEEACEYLADVIKSALDDSCPKSKIKDMNLYISEDTRKLIKAKRQIVRLARKTKDPEHKALALKLKTQIRKCIKIDKEEDLDRYTTGLDGERDPKKIWQGFNRIRGGKAQAITNNPVIQENGEPSENDKEKANAFAKTMGKILNTHQGPIFDDDFKKVIDDEINSNPHLFNPLQNKIIEPGDKKEILRNITISEIKFQLSKTKGRSAPGADGIRYLVIKKCPNIVFKK